MSISENMKQITDLASMLAGAVVSLEKKLENNSRLSAQATPREDEELIRDLSYATDEDLISEVLSRRLVENIIEALTSWRQDILFNKYGYFKKEDLL